MRYGKCLSLGRSMLWVSSLYHSSQAGTHRVPACGMRSCKFIALDT